MEAFTLRRTSRKHDGIGTESVRKQHVSLSKQWLCISVMYFREVVKTSILEQDPPKHKIDGGLRTIPLASSTSKNGVFVA